MRTASGFLCALLSTASLQGAAQLQTYLMTKPAPSATCTVLSTSPPPGYTSFSATETEAYLWFYVTGVSVGDVFASEYYNPSGTFYAPPSGAWNPASSAGNWCYTDSAFKIAGQVPATTPGLWTVKVKLNGALFFTLTFTITAAGAANPSLLNGGFEQPGTGNLWDIPVGSTHITGWNVTKGTVDYVNGLATCSEGKACIDLDGNTAGGISQTIQTTPGTAYTVTFDLAGNVEGGAKVKQVRVLAAGQSQDFSFDTTGRTFSSMGWTTKTWSFTANAASTTIEFSSLGPAGSWYGPFIDNVRVTTGGGGGATGTNVIRNWGAEEGPASNDCSGVASIPGWTTAGQATVCKYGASGGYPTASSPGPPDRGNNFFGGGYAASAFITQVVDLSSSATQIDAGSTPYTLSGWLGGYDSQGDNAKLIATFKSASGASLGTAQIGPATAADRQNVTGMVSKSTSGTVPASTRSVELRLEFTRAEGSSNDGYADSLSFSLSGAGTTPTCSYNVPPTSTVTGAGGTGTVQVTTTANCAWTATSNAAWLTLTSGASGTGSGTVTYTAAANPGTTSRTGTLTIAGQTHTVTQSAGGGTTPGCSYNVPLTSTVSGAGGTGIVLVTTAANCAWTATSNAAWLTIIAGASGTGNGGVNYRATANPSTTASRTGTLTIAGQTHTVTQGASTPACTYSISPTTASAPYTGTTAAVLVSAGTGCAWTATSSAAWITIKSGASGTGNGTVNYQVAANTATSSRTGTLTIAGQTFTLTQAAAPPADAPSISQGGVVNAASYIPATLPAGAIGQGSFFSVFGENLGPAQYAQATSFPLPTVLGEVSLKVTQGSTSVDAYPVFVSFNQINGILSSKAPVGDAQLTVTYKGKTSAPMPMKIAVNNFGIFSTAGGRGPGIVQNFVSQTEQPLNTRSTPAKPNQVEILWGTGLGPITAPDNLAPPAGDLPFPVEVLVGNKPAKKLYSGRAPCCSGVDQIVFEVPADAPTGCHVPVQIKVASTYSNIVTMAISADGVSCSSPLNPFSGITAAGGKSGSIVLARASVLAGLQAGQPPLDLTLDFGLGLFQQSQAVGDLGYNPLLSMPPLGACSASTGNLDLGQLLGTDLGGEVPGQESVLGRELDAGKELTVTGPKGNSIPMPRLNAEENKGPYVGLLGGSIPLEGAQSLPLFLDAGRYTVSGPGGKDVGPFKATIDIPTPLQWTNRSQITQVDRSSGLTLTWSGGDLSQQLVLIAGGSTDQKSKASGGFICFVPATGGSYTVPPSVLGNLPASVADKPEDSIGALVFGTAPAGNYAKFTATGLDVGYIFAGTLNAKTLPYK